MRTSINSRSIIASYPSTSITNTSILANASDRRIGSTHHLSPPELTMGKPFSFNTPAGVQQSSISSVTHASYLSRKKFRRPRSPKPLI